jgi:N-acetylglucosaminyl-diphospho-decaprenol L-rhamnosyltransferase
MRESLAVVIVSHNHGATLGPAVESLLQQEARPERIVVVDCGSTDTSWSKAVWARIPGVEIVLEKNLGFTGGNNLGWQRLAPQEGLVLFMNPDVLAPPGLLAGLRELSGEARAAGFGMISPRLAGYDFGAGRATGRLDSTGIFPRWSGGWYDRRERSPPAGDVLETVPALCGAFLLCRVAALKSCVRPAGGVFDERYFAYKEDIELALRLRAAGWKSGLWHGAEAWHGRGWQADRRAMPRDLRLISARNEMRLHATHAPARLPASWLKWLAVSWFDL